MDDDRLLAEILESPLDDDGLHRSLSGAVVVAASVLGVAAVAGGSLLLLSPSGDSATTTIAAAESGAPAGSAVVTDRADETTVPAEVEIFPEPSLFHEMVALGGGRILLFGGLLPLEAATAPLEGTWVLDAGVGEWSVADPDPAPSPRFGHAMALHPPTGKVVLFGGGTTQPRPCPRTRFCTGPENNEVWHYDPVTGEWEDMTPTVTDAGSWPVARFGARFSYEPVTERLVMFSGVGVFGEAFTPTFYDDTWVYDPVTATWEDLTSQDEAELRPIGRTTYGLAWDEETRRVMLFGGDSLSGTDDDHLWAFDPESATWEDLGAGEGGPHERWYHVLTTDPLSGRMVLFGGTGSILTPIEGGSVREIGALDDVWTWSAAEGWLARNNLENLLPVVSGAGEPGTLGVIAYDGDVVMSYDAGLDMWTAVVEREAPDDG